MATNSILTNTLSNTAQRFLDINTRRVGQSLERIASGIRTNRAADDVAGLAISDALRSDIRVLRQGVRNLNDGISLINVVEGALNEQSGAIIRLRELATQGASGTIGTFERQTLNLEISSLVAEIDRIAATKSTVVIYESTHRIMKTLKELADRIDDRPVVICRELTKLHETIYRGDAKEVTEKLESTSIKGEFVVVVGPKK